MATIIDPLIFTPLHKRKRPSRTRRPASCGFQNFKVTPSGSPGTPDGGGGSRTVAAKNMPNAFAAGAALAGGCVAAKRRRLRVGDGRGYPQCRMQSLVPE